MIVQLKSIMSGEMEKTTLTGIVGKIRSLVMTLIGDAFTSIMVYGNGGIVII